MITWRFYFWYFRDRYCSLYSPQLCWGLNGRSVIKEFARYNGLDVGDTKVAAQYFNKYCSNGCKSKSGKPKKIKDRNTISMNMKFHGREIDKFLCKKCFMKLYEMDEEKWNRWIERFKQDGCALFADEE